TASCCRLSEPLCSQARATGGIAREFFDGAQSIRRSRGRAVAGALKDAQKDTPGADGFAVLVGHETGKLMQVGEVVCGPRGQELAESDRPEGGMATAAVEIAGLDVHGAEL